MKNYFVLICALFIVNSSLHAMDNSQLVRLVDIAKSEKPDLLSAQKIVDQIDIGSDTSGKVADALCIATARGHYEYVQFLLYNKAAVDGKSSFDERTALMSAASYQNEKLVRLLLSYKASTCAVNNRSRTPLAFACIVDPEKVPNLNVVELLLTTNFVNHKDKDDRTPLFYAKESSRDERTEEHGKIFKAIVARLKAAGGQEYRYRELVNPQGKIEYRIDMRKSDVSCIPSKFPQAWDFEKNQLKKGWELFSPLSI
jgi:hypothetical protein